MRAAAARRQAALIIPSLIHVGERPDNRPRLSPGPVSSGQAVAPLARKKAISERDSLSLQDDTRCKARPEKTSGDGSARRFVPWCRKG